MSDELKQDTDWQLVNGWLHVRTLHGVGLCVSGTTWTISESDEWFDASSTDEAKREAEEFAQEINDRRAETSLRTHAQLEQARTHALDLIMRYGGIDGAHHKTWVIDQVVRALCLTADAYARWVAMAKEGDDGPETYSWDTGVAP